MSNSDNQPGPIAGRACAAQRLADALLRFEGNDSITLRVANPASGDNNSQLGLEAPSALDLQLCPVAIKNLPSDANGKHRIEATLSSRALESIAKTYGITDLAAWLLTAQALLAGGSLMSIESVVVDCFFGADCLYHIIATE